MEQKIEAILHQMTLVEKAMLLAGQDMWHTHPIPRLNMPAVRVSDGPNGVRGTDDNLGEPSICFPVGVAMGATWNPALVERVGRRLGLECRHRDVQVLLAPTVNIHRTPIAGRNFECFAEDPFLNGTIAAAYIGGLQQEGVSACIKHFVANDQEYERQSISANVAERPLHEIYLEPFRIAIQRANPWSLMSAYNRINGTYASQHDYLLREVLKERWGYDGYVISDWYGTYTDDVPAGALDLEMPGPARHMDPKQIVEDVTSGALAESVVDDKVRRLLRLMERVRAWDDFVPPPEGVLEEGLPRRVAAEAIVLLKNEGDILPLDPGKVRRIAVIGENARWGQIMGGGSSQVNPKRVVSPLEGIQARAGAEVQVTYALGTPVHRVPPLIPLNWLATEEGEPGLTLDYFHNLDLSGDPAVHAVVRKTELGWFGTRNPHVDPTHFSVRLSGTLTVPESGTYRLNLLSIGQARLWVADELLVEHPAGQGERESGAEVRLEADQPASIRIEYITDPDTVWRTLRLGCAPPQAADAIQAAVDLAAEADVAVVVAGLTRDWESEGFDRPDMELVGRQNELIARVAAANPNTVVVLNLGSPVTMPWLDAVPAVLQQWYGGQDAGHALADVLFGDENPSGKLPTTFPRRLEDNPAYINYPGENGAVAYGEGIFVGYRYYDKKDIAPLFPFGHGLSYTTFSYANLRLDRDTYGPGDEVRVLVDVTNTGSVAGQEVVQLYLQAENPRLVRPPQELKAFEKVALEPGETATVTLTLDRQSVAFYDPAVPGWVSEAGDFTVRVGSSSRDIRLEGRFHWSGDSPAG